MSGKTLRVDLHCNTGILATSLGQFTMSTNATLAAEAAGFSPTAGHYSIATILFLVQVGVGLTIVFRTVVFAAYYQAQLLLEMADESVANVASVTVDFVEQSVTATPIFSRASCERKRTLCATIRMRTLRSRLPTNARGRQK